MPNKKLITISVLVITVLLAGAALFTALKLFKIGQEPASPSPIPSVKAVVPDSTGKPQTPLIAQQEVTGPCELAFSLPIPSVSPSPSLPSNPSPTPSPLPECWETCTADSQCPGSLVCRNVSGVLRCINSSCAAESDCICGSSPVPSPSTSPAPSPSPSPISQCWGTCTTDSQCPNSLVCRNVSGALRCVNNSCQSESDCVCSGSPAPSPSSSTVPTVQLPSAGTVSPTLIFSLGGVALIILGLLL